MPNLPPPPADDDEQALFVELDDETWSAVRGEAEEQGVTPDLLALHALLYFVADVDSGRVGERLDDAVGE